MRAILKGWAVLTALLSGWAASGQTAGGAVSTGALAATFAENVDVQPEFPGDLLAYLADRLPMLDSNEAAEFGGKVVVGFTVAVDGRVRNAFIKRSSGVAAFDSGVMKMMRDMPRWKPAYKAGRPVESTFSLPVRICLD